jgi:O-antigen/teichoic acid export membrane protein
MLPILVTFLLRGGTFLGLWMGPQYAEPSGRVLLVLSIGFAFSATRTVILGAFVGLDRHRYLVPWYVGEAVTNLAVSVLLIHRMGIVGVAWGTTGPSLLMTLVVFPLVARRRLGIGVLRLFLQAWIRPFAALVPFATATWLVERWWPAHGLLMFFVQVAAVLPLAAAGTWLLALDPDQRREYLARHLAHVLALVRRPRQGT